MALADRDYARKPTAPPPSGLGSGTSSPRNWSITLWLVVINSAIFLLGAVSPRDTSQSSLTLIYEAETPLAQYAIKNATFAGVAEFDERLPDGSGFRRFQIYQGGQTAVTYYAYTNTINKWGHFSTGKGFFEYQVWRLVTYQFLHANLTHILFNMVGLWAFGPLVERELGRKRYLAFYLVGGIGGGILFLILNILGFVAQSTSLPQLPGALNVDLYTNLVGASGSIFALAIGAARVAPKTKLRLLFPPIDIDLPTVAYGFAVIAALKVFVFGGENQGGEAAHIGGAVAGYFFIRNTHLLRDFFDVFGNSNLPPKDRKKRGAAVSQEEVDRILDKVKERGLGALTAKERQRLEQASAGDG